MSVKCLPGKLEDLSFDPTHKKPYVTLVLGNRQIPEAP